MKKWTLAVLGALLLNAFQGIILFFIVGTVAFSDATPNSIIISQTLFLTAIGIMPTFVYAWMLRTKGKFSWIYTALLFLLANFLVLTLLYQSLIKSLGY